MITLKEKPLIGLTSSHDVDENRFGVLARYTTAVEQSGGVPIMIPLTESADCIRKYAEICDGVIFPGGDDVHPHVYGACVHEKCGEMTPLRDVLELKLAEMLFELDKPLFGVCRGIQAIGVAFGCTLYQDIPSEYSREICHRQKPPYSMPAHKVNVIKDSLLYKVTGKETLYTNSMHHQSLKNQGEKITVDAYADDGTVEAIEIKGMKFALAVQWHPEHLYHTDPAAKALFDKFVESCVN